MLVLSRLENEAICVGPDVEVVVVEIRRDKVRLGIKAPRELSVDRKEVRVAKGRNQPVHGTVRLLRPVTASQPDVDGHISQAEPGEHPVRMYKGQVCIVGSGGVLLALDAGDFEWITRPAGEEVFP